MEESGDESEYDKKDQSNYKLKSKDDRKKVKAKTKKNKRTN